MEFEMKRLEIQMFQAKATRACEKAQFGSLQKSFPIPPVMPASSSALTGMYVSPREESKKVQAIPESALTGMYVSPREESKKVQATPESNLNASFTLKD